LDALDVWLVLGVGRRLVRRKPRYRSSRLGV
jgi:hypothetical protein